MGINSIKEINIGDTIEYSIFQVNKGYTGETKQFIVTEKLLKLIKKYCSDKECKYHKFLKQ